MEGTELSPDRERRFVFDEVAELYARARPTYPPALIEDLISESALHAGSRILELGCGPGNASVLFAGRGYRLLCLEPGERLAAITRHRLAADPNAQVRVTTFEDWSLEAEAFDLVFAAQSFHWLDPVLRFTKTARALERHGTLAAFANRALEGTGPLARRIQEAYALYAPGLQALGPTAHTHDDLVALFSAAGDFQPPQWREYPWHAEYAASEYVDLLATHSNHRVLPQARRTALLTTIHEAIDNAGGRLGVDYVAVLCFARRSM